MKKIIGVSQIHNKRFRRTAKFKRDLIGNNFIGFCSPFYQYLEYILIKALYIRGKQLKEIIDIPILHSSQTIY